MSIETKLDALLPEEEYIVKWKKKLGESNIKLYLKVKLPNSEWSPFKAKGMKELFDKYNIPVDKISDSLVDGRITYSGNSKGTGRYKLISHPVILDQGERIVLKVNKELRRIGKIEGLMNVVKDHVAKHGKKKSVNLNAKEGIYKIIWPEDCTLEFKPEYLLLFKWKNLNVGCSGPLEKKGKEYAFSKPNSKKAYNITYYWKPLKELSSDELKRVYAGNEWDLKLKRVCGLKNLAPDVESLLKDLR